METVALKRIWVRVKAAHPAFMAFMSELKDANPDGKQCCPNCASRLLLGDIKDFIKQKDNKGNEQVVAWNIECSNCLARLEILDDTRE